MAKKTKTDVPSLAEIRSSLSSIEKQRELETLSTEEREILELASVALRDAERLVIEKIQKSIIKDMEVHTNSVNLLAKEIRSKITQMNKLPNGLDKVESTIKIVLKLIGEVTKWL